MINKDFEYAKRFEDWLKGKNLNGIQEDVLSLRIENEQLKRVLERKKETIEIYKQTLNEKEIQIEKMKCCGNCAKNGHICVAEEMQGKLCGKNKVKWQLRR